MPDNALADGGGKFLVPMSISTFLELMERCDRLQKKIDELWEVERQSRLRDEPRCPDCGVEWNYHRDDLCTVGQPVQHPETISDNQKHPETV